ncbi:MAG: restriction endonuclease subunit S, partial [Cryomorphaceae bacterium]
MNGIEMEVEKDIALTETQQKPGYKKTKLGWIPEEWQFVEFDKVAGKSAKKYDPASKESLPCVELEHIEQETGSINGYVNSVDQKSIKSRFFRGEVLFGKLRPYLRKYWIAEFDGVCSSEIWVLIPRKELMEGVFLHALIQQHRFIQAANVTSGSKMPRADWDFVSKFPILVPPLPEQRAIAAVLSTWDRA